LAQFQSLDPAGELMTIISRICSLPVCSMLLLALQLVTCLGASHVSDATAKRSLIEGGYATSAWPSVFRLLITKSGGSSSCTAQMIHPRVALTAGHCVSSPSQGDACGRRQTLCIGSPGLDTPAGCVRQPSSIQAVFDDGRKLLAVNISTIDRWDCGTDCGIIYQTGSRKLPCFSDGADIALLLFGENVPVPVVPVMTRNTLAGESGCIVGYGVAMSSGSQKRQGTARVNRALTGVVLAGGPAQMCSGDSGGGLFLNDGSGWAVAGTTHAGDGGGTCSFNDGYYTAVTPHLNWIKDSVLAWTGDALGTGVTTAITEQCEQTLLAVVLVKHVPLAATAWAACLMVYVETLQPPSPLPQRTGAYKTAAHGAMGHVQALPPLHQPQEQG